MVDWFISSVSCAALTPGFCHRDEHPQQFQIDIA